LRHLFSIRYDQRVNIDNVPFGKGITGAAAESREWCACTTPARTPATFRRIPGITLRGGRPLMAHDRVLGVLDLESEAIGYSRRPRAHPDLLAPQVASSVENARL